MESLLSTLLSYLFYVVGSVLGIIGIWAVKQYLIPFLKEKLGLDAYTALTTKIKDLMASAESNPDFIGSGHGSDKKEWVIAQLKALGVNFNEDYVRNLINGFTNELTAQGVINQKKDEITTTE